MSFHVRAQECVRAECVRESHPHPPLAAKRWLGGVAALRMAGATELDLAYYRSAYISWADVTTLLVDKWRKEAGAAGGGENELCPARIPFGCAYLHISCDSSLKSHGKTSWEKKSRGAARAEEGYRCSPFVQDNCRCGRSWMPFAPPLKICDLNLRPVRDLARSLERTAALASDTLLMTGGQSAAEANVSSPHFERLRALLTESIGDGESGEDAKEEEAAWKPLYPERWQWSSADNGSDQLKPRVPLSAFLMETVTGNRIQEKGKEDDIQMMMGSCVFNPYFLVFHAIVIALILAIAVSAWASVRRSASSSQWLFGQRDRYKKRECKRE